MPATKKKDLETLEINSIEEAPSINDDLIAFFFFFLKRGGGGGGGGI